MKKLVSLSMLLVMSFSLYAQERDVTRFLGIPVDGSKKDMIQKLKAKGFESIPESADMLEGEFNGTEVWIGVATDNNKVWRVGVIDKNSISEGDIKIRYNALCRQFENNSKYMSFIEDQTIPDDTDISYQMTVYNKRYEAAFYQAPIITDTVSYTTELSKFYFNNYGVTPDADTLSSSEQRTERIVSTTFSIIQQKSVWFMINQLYGKFYIAMFYDNEYNHANGEDL